MPNVFWRKAKKKPTPFLGNSAVSDFARIFKDSGNREFGGASRI